jgi:site-specific DNA recombinase
VRITQPLNTSRGSAAIYARQSRTDDSKKDKQKKDQHVETTLDTQSAACRKEATLRGFRVDDASVFSERYTGAEMWDRPVLSDLRRRIKAKEYTALFVYSTDRLARDPIHLALILEECQRANCELVFVTEPLEDSPEGELILYIKGYAAKIERLRIKDRMARGRNAITAAGKLNCSGTPLYGYQFDFTNRTRIIDPPTASIVKDIFRWTTEGQSGCSIAKRLNTMGVPCPSVQRGTQRQRGKPIWFASAVNRILHNESYCGVTHVNKTRATDERTKKTGRHKVAPVAKEEWKTLPDGVTPAIVDRATFDQAHKMMAKNTRRADYSRNSVRPRLLRGVLFCADCGCPMYPMMSDASKDGLTPVYRCSASRRKPDYITGGQFPLAVSKCKAKRIIGAPLEEIVWSKLVTFLLNPKIVEREVERVLSAVPDTTLTVDLDGAETQLARSRRLRDAALIKYDEAIREGDDELAARWDDKIKEASSDMRALSAVIADLNARLAAYNNSSKTARAFAVQCKKVLANDHFTFAERRAALEALNVKVYAADGKQVRIQLNTALVTEQVRSNVAVEVCV